MKQEDFDAQFITSAEILTRLGISRTALSYAKKFGRIPQPITINGGTVQLWNRNEMIPIIEQWLKEEKNESRHSATR